MKNEPLRWKRDYEETGYLVVEDCVDPRTLDRMRKAIERITADPDAVHPLLKQHILFERSYSQANPGHNDLPESQVGNAIKNIMELPLFDPVFAQFIAYEPLLDILEAVMGTPEFSFRNYKCIVKAPRVSSIFRWHRDLPYLMHTTSNLVTAMVCLDDMTAQNGATVILPGSHRIPDASVTWDDMNIPDGRLPAGERVLVDCPAGSVVLFHVKIIHGGPANRSDRPRRNVIGIWAGPDTHPLTSARFAYHDLMPRSHDPSRRDQVRRSFPGLYSGDPSAPPIVPSSIGEK